MEDSCGPAVGTASVLAIAFGLMTLGGCATFSRDGGFGDVERVAKERLDKTVVRERGDADVESIRATVRHLIASPLSVDNAVQVALLNNRGLQAAYADLGIAEADLVQAGRLSNPHFAYLDTQLGGEHKIEWGLTFPIVDLLTMPLRREVEGRRFQRVKLEVAGRVLDLAAETRRTWFRAVAAAELARYGEQVTTAAEAAAELSRRMAQVGNATRLDQMRQQVFYAEAAAQLAQARNAALAERERLTRLMGLYGEEIAFTLPERLPGLPGEKPGLQDLEALAIARRMDVLAARRDAEAMARSLGLTKATRVVNVLELGPAFTKEDPEPWKRGFEVRLEMPIFDWGGARVARAEAHYMQALHRVAYVAVNARSEVREAYASYLTAYETAKHYRDEVVPLRNRISEESLLRYNGMLIGVFELLADARERVASVAASMEALRDFWLAETDLEASLNGARTGGRASASRAHGVMAPEPAPAGH